MNDTFAITLKQRVRFIPHNGKAKAHFLPPQPLRKAVAAPTNLEPRTWCAQCDRLVYAAEAQGCASPWCKAKLAKLEAEARG